MKNDSGIMTYAISALIISICAGIWFDSLVIGFGLIGVFGIFFSLMVILWDMKQ